MKWMIILYVIFHLFVKKVGLFWLKNYLEKEILLDDLKFFWWEAGENEINIMPLDLALC